MRKAEREGLDPVANLQAEDRMEATRRADLTAEVAMVRVGGVLTGVYA